MALTYTANTAPVTMPHRVGLFWPHLQGWMARYARAMARTDQIAELDALSDAELAALGLTRDRIVLHVFRDRAWV